MSDNRDFDRIVTYVLPERPKPKPTYWWWLAAMLAGLGMWALVGVALAAILR